MPLLQFFTSGNAAIGLWEISESEKELLALTELEAVKTNAAELKNQVRRTEFLASRILLQEVQKKLNLPVELPFKDDNGCPCLQQCNHKISLSHTTGMAAVIVTAGKAAGIDLEPTREQILKLAPKFLSEEELQEAKNDVLYTTICWSIKETIYKLYSKKKLLFAKHMRVHAFGPDPKGGTAFATLSVNNTTETYPIEYRLVNNLVLTWCAT
jgi:4'-phosphopantetheinyl transferase